MSASAHSIVLVYSVSIGRGPQETIRETVELSFSQCHYGGQRPYFRCPGIVNGLPCNQRVGKLFAGGRYFLCRHCYDIAYSSQSEARYDRMLRKANKRRKALGGEPGTANWIAPKPKGMWHRTYERHRFEIEWCEYQANRLFIAKFQHLLSPEDLADYLAD